MDSIVGGVKRIQKYMTSSGGGNVTANIFCIALSLSHNECKLCAVIHKYDKNSAGLLVGRENVTLIRKKNIMDKSTGIQQTHSMYYKISV
jgi:hypothetical protein